MCSFFVFESSAPAVAVAVGFLRFGLFVSSRAGDSVRGLKRDHSFADRLALDPVPDGNFAFRVSPAEEGDAQAHAFGLQPWDFETALD